MTKLCKFKKISNIFKIAILIIAIFILLVNPKLNMSSFLNGLNLWAMNVLPALFPILFITSILNSTGAIQKLGQILSPITRKLFNCSGLSGYIYAVSVFSGYPVGAKVTSELYEKGLITYAEACRITAFSSTSGPLFILGSVAVGMFGNIKLGIFILVSHLLGALINGVLFRNLYKGKTIGTINVMTHAHDENLLENCMLSSIKSILIIGGYISLSYILITILEHYNIFLPLCNILNSVFGIDVNITNSILNGVIEMTKGVKSLSQLSLNESTSAIISTAIISLGGLSTFLQAYTYLAKIRIKLSVYLVQKILHTALAVTICSILCIIF